ncbi:MAG: family 20 glycosylhydrolase [Bacteroidota bacterium]
MKLKRFTKFIFLLFLSGKILSQCPIIPSPNFYIENRGKFDFSIFIETDFAQIPTNLKSYFKKQMMGQFHTDLLQIENQKPALSFKKNDSNLKNDFYSIEINSKNVIISYTSDASCFYAINSFLQLIEEKNGSNYIKSCEINDSPKFEWRGLHLDVSRHFFTVEEVKRYIDLMAFYKFNTFHWHLTDDQGWRIEIKKYSKLTEIGAWRDSTVNKHYTTNPRTYTVEKYGGFYTQEQIKELVKYAQERYVAIVPEIEMPGHSRAALAAYPEFSCTGEKQNVPGLWGVFDDIYCAKQESIDFNKAILDEVLELFPSTYIHVGGDEAPKERWKKCPNCQKVIQENKLKDEHELQSYFIRQIDAYLTSKGRKLIGWDEILEGGLSPNASVMSWRGTEGGIEAVKEGHSVVMSPGSHCYFDHYQSKNPNEPIAFGGFTPIEKVYEFNPIPANLTSEQEKLILGAQANLWTEYIPDMKQLEYMTFPRALALSQVLWCKNKPKFSDFQKVLVNKHLKILSDKHVNYSKALFYPKSEIKRVKNELIYSFQSIGNFNYVMFGFQNKKGSSVKILEQKVPLKNYQMRYNWNVEISPLMDQQVITNLSYSYQIHDALGKKINFITPPSQKYAFNKELALVDGISGRIPWNSSEWLGFNTSEIVLEMNLEKVENILFIDLSFLDDVSSWIHIPKSIEIQISPDGKRWTMGNNSTLTKNNHLTVNQEAKFIRFVIHQQEKIPDGFAGAGNIPWTFMDEISIDLE